MEHAMTPSFAAALADAVLVLHVAVAAFVVGGLLLILLGRLAGWRWVHRRGFRLAHLAAIGVVVAEAWFGVVCPLTSLEMWLRTRAGSGTYGGGFVEHWLQRLLYFDAPPWVFVVGYTVFGLIVAAAWWYVPPDTRSPGAGEPNSPTAARTTIPGGRR